MTTSRFNQIVPWAAPSCGAALLLWTAGFAAIPAARAQATLAQATQARATQVRTAQKPGPQIPVLTWEPRSDWTSVRTTGAVGDGVADDTAAIQKAFDGFKEGGTVYLPAGTYRITKTLIFKGPFTGATVIGHGRDTRLVWDGEVGGKLFSDDGIAHSRYVGITFDGAGKAAIGFWHHSMVRFETEVRHQHLAFLNFTEAGVATDSKDNYALAETLFENCLFDNCKVGISFKSFNDYNYTFAGCEFRNCGIGIEARHGNFYARECHFENNSVIDMIANGEHNSSARRCTSVGSNAFISSASTVGALSVQDCRIDRWKSTEGAVRAQGAPLIIFDTVFTNPPQGTAPVRVTAGNLQLIASQNRAEGSPEVIAGGHAGRVYDVPAGKRTGSLRSANQRFLQSTARIPGKIFDAKRDFGAKGDGTSDDTKAIQAAIDAARAHGKGAMAYLPQGAYGITSTLRITGRDYYFGGGGFRTGLVWRGVDGGTMVSVHDPLRVAIENLNVGSHDMGQMNNGIDILQTSSGKTSHMSYDGVNVFGMYQKQPRRKGLRFSGLGSGDTVLLPHVQGNLTFTDCGQATILGNATFEGTVIVEGKDKRRGGFLGFQTRLATIVTHGALIRDNHSFVASDFYIEESDDGFLLEGAPGDPPGRVTITGAKLHIKSRGDDATPARPLDLRNYQGQVFFGPYQFYPGSQGLQFHQQGERPVELFLQAVTFYGTIPSLQVQKPARVFSVGNSVVDAKPLDYMFNPQPTEATLRNLSNGFDDLRRLGELDLKLNFPDGK